MKKLLMGVGAISLLVSSSLVYAVNTVQKDYAGNSAAATKAVVVQQETTGKNAEGATPVKYKADGADYSEGAGDKAAMTDMGIDTVSAAATGWSIYKTASAMTKRSQLTVKSAAWEQKLSAILTAGSSFPTWARTWWFPVYFAFDWVGIATQLGHAAVNKFMRDATNITASFAGEQGYVTDKWVGPPAMNKSIKVLDAVKVTSHKFGSLGFNADNYPGLKDAQKASAAELMQYRSDEFVEDQRSLKNVTDTNWGLLYRAQRRSIQGLASALELKKSLSDLASVETMISAEYGTKPKALNTVASRRSLHDALMLLRLNVMAARTRLRAEILELDFKPQKKVLDFEEKKKVTTPQLTPTI